MMRSMNAAKTTQAGSVALRRAGPRDAGAIADVLIRSRQASVGSIPAAVHPDGEIRGWIKGVVIPEREVWLAESAEGAWQGSVLGTYSHGPALSRNPLLADMLLRWATGIDLLDPIDDIWANRLRGERLAAAAR